jgi:hypothetical protein
MTTENITIEEIEKAVEQLPPHELARFRAWFEAFDADQFDAAIERDAQAGKLDGLAEKAVAELVRNRRLRELAAIGQRRYDSIREVMERDHFGAYVMINTDTSDYVVAPTISQADAAFIERFGEDAPGWCTRIGVSVFARGLRDRVFEPPPDELAGIDRGLCAAAEGRFATDQQVEAVFEKFRGK